MAKDSVMQHSSAYAFQVFSQGKSEAKTTSIGGLFVPFRVATLAVYKF